MKCLIVDDSLESREYMRTVLESRAACETAKNGAEAVSKFEQAQHGGQPFDVVVLDVDMPDMSGHEVFDRFREIERQRGVEEKRQVKAIIVSGHWNSAHYMSAFKQGCENYIGKPVDPAELLAEFDDLVPQSRIEATAGAPRHFLIVDDDELCRELVKSILKPFGICDTAHDGREAVDVFRLAIQDNRRYDLILLDIMMPDMDGHAALEAIRNLERSRRIFGSDGVKVIMTTALRDSKHCTRSFVEGCDSYITKPIDEYELLKAVAAAFSGISAKPQPALAAR